MPASHEEDTARANDFRPVGERGRGRERGRERQRDRERQRQKVGMATEG